MQVFRMQAIWTSWKRRSIISGKTALCILATFLVGVSVVWATLNISSEPQYGDTPEYWKLSHTLQVDTWRTVGYPLVLKVDQLIFSKNLEHAALYILQLAISLGCAYYFFRTLSIFLPSSKRASLLMAILLVSIPVVAHFNFAVLTDSLANSLFILVMSATLRLMVSKATVQTGAIAIGGLIAMGLIREDRLLASAVIIGIVLVWALFRHNKALALMMVLLFVVSISVAIINKSTQTADLGRPQMSLTFTLFDRTVRGRLWKLMPKMPRTIQQRITPQMAQEWDQHQNYWATINTVLDDSAGRSAMKQAVKVAIKNNALSIVGNLTSTFFAYIATPFSYAKESLYHPNNPGSYWTYWTNSRMAQAQPRITHMYQNIFWILFFSTLLFLVWHIKAAFLIIRRYQNLMIFWLVVVLVTAAMHTLQSSIGFHIRYALPIFSIESGMLIYIVFHIRQSKDPLV